MPGSKAVNPWAGKVTGRYISVLVWHLGHPGHPSKSNIGSADLRLGFIVPR